MLYFILYIFHHNNFPLLQFFVLILFIIHNAVNFISFIDDGIYSSNHQDTCTIARARYDYAT